MSNLPLQMSLYFNVIFAPLWCIPIILFLNENVGTTKAAQFPLIYYLFAVSIIHGTI